MSPVYPLVSLWRTRGSFQLGKCSPAKPPIFEATGWAKSSAVGAPEGAPNQTSGRHEASDERPCLLLCPLENVRDTLGVPVCTENLIRVDDVMESPRLAE
jgi:hypothetical protein